MSHLSRLGFIDTHRTTDPVGRRVRSRDVPTELASHELFYTEDPDRAGELIAEAFAPNRLTVGDRGAASFAAGLYGVRFRDVSLLYLDLHIPVTLDVAHCGGYYAVHMPTHGRAVGTVAAQPFEANPIRALVTNPGDALHVGFDHDSPQLIVRIEQEALERYVSRVTGRRLGSRLAFAPDMDLTTDAAVRWHGAVQLLQAEVYYSGSLVNRGLAISPLEDLLMSSLLNVQPSTHHEQLVRPQREPGRRTVRHALDYIEDHLAERITMSDVSEHAGASIRSIQQGFRDELGVTPMAYLRDRRLERAREELTDVEPADGVTVTAVAERWGFHHLGSFAVLYRKRWGESPSETLRH